MTAEGLTIGLVFAGLCVLLVWSLRNVGITEKKSESKHSTNTSHQH